MQVITQKPFTRLIATQTHPITPTTTIQHAKKYAMFKVIIRKGIKRAVKLMQRVR